MRRRTSGSGAEDDDGLITITGVGNSNGSSGSSSGSSSRNSFHRNRSSNSSVDESRDFLMDSFDDLRASKSSEGMRKTATPVWSTSHPPLRNIGSLDETRILSTTTTSTSTSIRKAEAPSSPLPPAKGDEDGEEEDEEEEEADMADYKRKHRARLRSPWSCSPATLSCTAIALLLLFVIVQSFLSRQLDPKGCAMSYMRAAFAKFNDFDTEHTRFASKYSLYLYREGGIDEDTRVKGIPVLFIPGNAGSYKQVRPIAAEAAYYFHDNLQADDNALRSGKRALDFFSVDFNEDITAFHGQTLLDQAEYLNEAIAYILALYHNPHRSLRDSSLPDPTSVIIVGHSMGGIVARTMLTMPNYQANTINTIITLSAPHARAPVSFDADIVNTYKNINDFWRSSYALDQDHNPLSQLTLVSIAGGGLDTVVPSDYASLTSLVPQSHGFTVFTSTIPRVWTGMDHLAIMWCDQFRKAVVRALYDIVDVNQASQTLARPERMRRLRKHFLTGMEPDVQHELAGQEPRMLLTLEDQSTAILPHGERLVLNSLGRSGKAEAHVLPIPVQSAAEKKRFTLMTDQLLNGQSNIEVFVCSVHPPQSGSSAGLFTFTFDFSGNTAGAARLACKSAAPDAVALPASKRDSHFSFDDAQPFWYLHYDLDELADYQFVAVIDKATQATDGWVVGEFSAAAESSVSVDKSLYQLMFSGIRHVFSESRAMVNEIHIPQLHSSLLAYHLKVKSQCKAGSRKELFRPLLRQYIQEPHESKYFPNVGDANINLHGVSPYVPPPANAVRAKGGLSLQIWSDPTCNSTMDVHLSIDIIGSAGKLVMRYRTVFAAFPLLVVALVLRKQFQVYDATGIFMSFTEGMDQCIRTSLPVLFAALSFLSLALSKTQHATIGDEPLAHQDNATETPMSFTKNELLLGSHDPFFWFLVPLFGFICVGVCIAANYVVLALTYIFTATYTRIRTVSLRNDEGRRSSTAFAVTSPLQRIVTTSVLLLMVATIIPYQFAFMVLCLVQLATCIRALRLAHETRDGANSNFYNYTHSLLVLMLWVLPINLPVLVVWIHNLAVHWLTPFSSHHNILSIMPYILVVETMSTGHMIPRLTGRLRIVTNLLLFALAIYAAVYGVTYAYVLHQLVNGLCAWLAIIHFSNSPISPARLSEVSWRSQGHVKKRP